MKYKEAYSIFNNNGDPDEFFVMVLNGDSKAATEYVIKITGCDEVTAKAIVLDFSDGLITENTNKNNTIASNQNIPRCPTCSSSNIAPIGAVERVGSVAMLGVFSKKINKSYKCKDCGYTW